ncbi:MAG: chemotaxis-specific protein-glutamate methyltransferase CheB [Bacteroidota bacterium]
MEKEGRIKALLIEDSGLMRIMISDALRSDPHIQVVGTANNGKDGVAKADQLEPDVVITDLIMPEYDGLYAVKHIMEKRPVPIILLSSLGRESTDVFEALNAGAFDFIDKPATKDSKAFKLALADLNEKVKVAFGSDSSRFGKQVDKTNHNHHTFEGELQYDIIAIGASTGGPSAIESIITQLPENLAVPVIITQHMPERFLISFAERLEALIPLTVKVPAKGEQLSAGTIYITPGDGNVALQRDRSGDIVFEYTEERYKEFNDPSVDCMFISIAEHYGAKVIGIILTGMGKDGSQGMVKIKDKGGLTIAQDAASCVVNGMPQAAVNIGAVDHVVGLKEIPGFVMSCF